MARRRRQYDPAKDNPLLGDMALLIVGAVAGVAGVGYIAYKYGQSSAPRDYLDAGSQDASDDNNGKGNYSTCAWRCPFYAAQVWRDDESRGFARISKWKLRVDFPDGFESCSVLRLCWFVHERFVVHVNGWQERYDGSDAGRRQLRYVRRNGCSVGYEYIWQSRCILGRAE